MPLHVVLHWQKSMYCHKIKHPELFDEDENAVCIRSSEGFCENEYFFRSNYIIKYSCIPVSCPLCTKDLLHHIEFHSACQFCMQNWYKHYPKTEIEFNNKKNNESYYFRTVCPRCDKKFSEPHIVKKHIEFNHKRKALFECDDCHLVFQSKQANEYHKRVHHSDATIPEKCKVCEKTFPSKVSLQSHTKYVHSNEKKYSCGMCDSKFK